MKLEVLHHNPMFIVDDVHNEQCVDILINYISEYLLSKKIVFLTDILIDKECISIIEQILPYTKGVVCLTEDNIQTLTLKNVLTYITEKGYQVIVGNDLETCINTALEIADGDTIILFGSPDMNSSIRLLLSGAYKKWQRKTGIKARNALSKEVRKELSNRIVQQILKSDEFQKANIIMSYKAVKGEVDLRELDAEAEALGKKIVYPYCVSSTEMIGLLPHGKDAWIVGHYGIMEPIPERSNVITPDKIDLVLCPCSAFDHQCNRLGMGAGYYDRYLEKCHNACIVSVAFEAQRVKLVETCSWDRPMQMTITEDRIYLCSLRKGNGDIHGIMDSAGK